MKKVLNSIKKIFIVVQKELLDYFGSPTAYVVLSFFAITIGVVFVKDLFVNGLAEMRAVFTIAPIVMIFVIPALTMRSYAEEKQTGTYEILTTMPLNTIEILLAKFFSNFIFSLFLVLIITPIPLVLNIIGQPNNGQIFAGFLGITVLCASYIAIGQFISINTNNQVPAFLVTVAVIGILYVFGMKEFLELIPVRLQNVFDALSLKSHFDSVTKGVIDSRDVLYYFSIFVLMFYFTYKSILRIRKKGI
jgi:ABC-2 type transport system permease protein